MVRIRDAAAALSPPSRVTVITKLDAAISVVQETELNPTPQPTRETVLTDWIVEYLVHCQEAVILLDNATMRPTVKNALVAELGLAATAAEAG